MLIKDTKFTKAVRSGNLKKVCKMLDAGANPDENDKYDWCALNIAVKKNRFEIVKKLVEAGAQIDGVEKDSITPLMDAVKLNNVDIIHYLIDNGANINASLDGNAPVVKNIQSEEVLKIFIKAGAFLDGALESAVYDQNVEFVRIIIESKARLKSKKAAKGLLEIDILRSGRTTELEEIETLLG